MTNEKLPNSEKAVVEYDKLTKYLLSLDHPGGKGKANFLMQHGFRPTEWEVLRTSLLNHGATQPVVQVEKSDYGAKYVLECSVASQDQRNPCIRSIWIVEAGQSSPRLVTAYANPL